MGKLNAQKLRENIEANMARRMADGRVGNAELIVNQNGERVYHGLFGTNGVGGPAVTPDCIYRAASMTKLITTAAVMQCVEKGLIDLYAPLSDYLPEFAHMNIGHVEERDGKKIAVTDRPARTPILFFQLLCHSSGVGCGEMGHVLDKSYGSPEKTTAYYATQPLAFDPYSDQAYSGSASFVVASRVLEIVTGEPFGPYVAEHICKPLGLVDTTFEPTEEQFKRLVILHKRDENGKSVDCVGFTKPGMVIPSAPASAWCAGAGMITTCEEYSTFAETLLNFGLAPNGNRILTEKSVRLMQTPHLPEFIMGGSQRYGLGARIVTMADYPHKLPIGSWGWSGAFGSHFWVDPVNRVTAVMMRSTRFDGGAGADCANEFERNVMDAME